MATTAASPTVTVTVDLTRIDEKDFDGSRPLRIAAVRDGKIIDQKTVTPGKEKNPRSFPVQISLGEPEDGVAGAEIVVAPADDERNIHSKLAARKFVASAGRVDPAVIRVNPAIYGWWRYCWFPRTYHVTGRVVRTVDDCTHPVGGAHVEIFDVDYCWWFYREDLITSQVTDANGFFDITFQWCVPLWCLLFPVATPLIIDPLLRDRIYEILKQHVIIKWPPPPPPPDPWEWERQLGEFGIDVPARQSVRLPDAGKLQVPQLHQLAAQQTAAGGAARSTSSAAFAAAPPSARQAVRFNASDIFKGIIYWPPCDEPCDWLPDVKIRVTQTQPGGTVVIYQDTYWQIHFNLDHDLINLTLEANASALYADDCHPNPLLGNCMLFDAVGAIKIMPTVDPVTLIEQPNSGIYQPDVTPGLSYGVTPDRRQRIGYVRDNDQPWAGMLSVYGRFGIAAGVDYYQVQHAKWTAADLLAWDVNHAHVPPEAAFTPVPVSALGAVPRSYLEQSPTPQHWPNEPFAPHTVGVIPGLYKSRERFEQEYRDAHGGNNPAPDFGGWYWYWFTETRLFSIDASQLSTGVYTFRLACYRQTGVDGSGTPTLALVNMGLPGGIGRRCQTVPAKPELVTLYLHDTVVLPDSRRSVYPDCEILTFTKNGVTIDECAMVTLTPGDSIDLEYRAFDPAGNLGGYGVTLQKGSHPPHDLFTLAGVTAVPGGSAPEGRSYAAALADPTTPAVPPYWYGGSWKKNVSYATFLALGGTCAYNLRVTASNRHTDGFSSFGSVDANRAFTITLAP